MATSEPKYTIEACRSENCKAPVIWARTENRAMPVDAAPSAVGNVRLFQAQGFTYARVVTKDEAERMRRDPKAVPLRTSHFATCPDSAKWRKDRS